MKELDNILNLMYDKMLSNFDGMTSVASALACLGALLYICYRVFSSLSKAAEIEIFPLLRPFAIGLCITFFQPAILKPMNSILNAVNSGVENITQNISDDVETARRSRDKAKETFDKAQESGGKIEVEEVDENGKLVKREKTITMDDAGSGWLSRALMWVIEWLAKIIFFAAEILIKLIRIVFLLVLSIMGSIVFAFSVFDGLSSGISNWFSKYISISLWSAIISILNGVLASVQIFFFEWEASEYLQSPDGEMPINAATLSTAFYVVGTLGILAVPTLASWIVVNGGGTGGFGRALNVFGSSAGGYTGAALGGFAGSAMGATGKGLTNLGKSIGGFTGSAMGATGKGLTNLGNYIKQKK